MGNVEYYNLLSIVMAVAAGVMLIMTLLLWFKLNIKRDFAVLSGSEARKDIEKIRREASAGTVQADLRRKGRGSVISWNTSERFKSGDLQNNAVNTIPQQPFQNPVSFGMADPNATTVLGAPVSDPDATTVLGAPALDPDATTVLGASNPTPMPAPASNPAPANANNGFVIEREERT